MAGVRLVLAELGELVRQRFPAADGLVCSCGDGDTILWQVVAGHDVVWNALPDVDEQIPQWHALPLASDLLQARWPPKPKKTAMSSAANATPGGAARPRRLRRLPDRR